MAFSNQSARHRELRARRGVRSRSYPGEDGRPPHTRWGFGLVRHFLRMSWPLKGWLPSLSKAWIRIIFCTIFLRAISACCGRPAGNWRPAGMRRSPQYSKGRHAEQDRRPQTRAAPWGPRRGEPGRGIFSKIARPRVTIRPRSGAAGRRPYSICYQYLIRLWRFLQFAKGHDRQEKGAFLGSATFT